MGGGMGGAMGKEEGSEVESLEVWPERRVSMHAEEWLEAMGVEEAIWDDFAPGCFAEGLPVAAGGYGGR